MIGVRADFGSQAFEQIQQLSLTCVYLGLYLLPKVINSYMVTFDMKTARSISISKPTHPQLATHRFKAPTKVERA